MKSEERILAEVSQGLQQKFNQEIRVEEAQSISGGDINSALKVTTNIATFFVKYNNGKLFPEMFHAEAKGLNLMRQTRELIIPEVILSSDDFLILNYVDSATPKKDFWETFGIQLAKMHRHSGESFGLDHNNYIGSLPQFNSPNSSWVDFFITQRLSVQCKLAHDKGRVDADFVRKFEKLFYNLENIFPQELPALIHGDLWSGNYTISPNGNPIIMDPAVYFGHREMDIGMSKLFGGFNDAFYRSYNDEFPLERNWESRIDIANLYPLMVHVNLFGGGYVHQVEGILKRFI